MLAKAFMIGSRGFKWSLNPYIFRKRTNYVHLWHNHDLLLVSLGSGRKTFDCALTHDLLKQCFSCFPTFFTWRHTIQLFKFSRRTHYIGVFTENFSMLSQCLSPNHGDLQKKKKKVFTSLCSQISLISSQNQNVL